MHAYHLSSEDVIADRGVSDEHMMSYAGNGTVVQIDPAEIWQYKSGTNCNISFYGLDTLNGSNVKAPYIHMPTFHGAETVRTTVLCNGTVLNNFALLKAGSGVFLIGSFPDGVVLGNYPYE
jgi:hypothetical protein